MVESKGMQTEEDTNKQQVSLLDEKQVNSNYSEMCSALLDIQLKWRPVFPQVGELLKRMDLSDYVPRFRVEHVDGMTLLECDDATLRDDLGVTPRVHRLRLLQVITGRKSLHCI